MTASRAPERARRLGLAATGAAVVLGIALRVAAAYPVHKYPADADCLNSGLVALRISDGHPAVWLTPRRHGALECYGHAIAFRLFGISRSALAATPLVSSSLALVLFAALAFAWAGPVAGPLATLLFAMPPPAYLFWTYMPNSYPETMLFCVAIVLAGERVRRAPGDPSRIAVLGLVAGLGFWNSIQTLAATLPVLVTLLATSRRELLRARPVAVLGAAFLAGGLPWFAWNALVPLGSFQHNFSVRPAAGLRSLADNVRHLFTYELPELVASVDPENGPNPPGRLTLALRGPVLAVWAAAALYALGRGAAALVRRLRGNRAAPPPETPFLLVGLTVCVLLVLSGAGEMRGLTVRYVLPAFLVLPLALALAVTATARRSPAGAVVGALAVGAVLVFNVSAYFLPGSAARRLWEKKADADSDLVAFLDERGIEAVTGDYWVAYPVNFLSRRRIAAVPFQPGADFYDVEGSLGVHPRRWAIVGRTRDDLERLIAWTGDSGLLVETGFERWVFIPEKNEQPAVAFVSRYRTGFLAPH